jgi:hypothetical protein
VVLGPIFEIPSLLILDLTTLTLPSNPISKLTYSLLQAFLATSNSIGTLLIQHFHIDFSVEIILNYITLQIQLIDLSKY